MTTTLAEVLHVVEGLWPASGAESWDAPGLVSGDPAAEVQRIHLTVDVVAQTVDEAIDVGADLLFSHHPLLLRGVTTVSEQTYKGSVVARLIRANCALIAAHTNADVVESGTSATLANRLGLRDIRPITAGQSADRGIGRIGMLAHPVTLGRLASMLAEILPATAGGIRVSGDFERPVSTVALCAGAGDSLLSDPAVVGADAYVTSDLRHHPASEFRETTRLSTDAGLLDVSHWASEWLWLDTAADQLRQALPGVQVSVSELRTDPWDFVVVQ